VLREALGLLARIIINSIFVYPSAQHRRASLLSKAVFLSAFIAAFYEVPWLGLLLLAEVFTVYYLSTGELIEPFSMLVLSSIPAVWMASTGALFLWLSSSLTLSSFIGIFYKTLFYSFSAMLVVSILTPSDISAVLYRFTRKIAFPFLLWSLIPFQLRDAEISLRVQEMKGNPLSSSIFIIFSEQLERADQIMLANSSRLSAGAKRLIRKRESRKFTMIFYCLAALNLAVTLLIIFR